MRLEVNFPGPRLIPQAESWSMVQLFTAFLSLASSAPAAEVAFIEFYKENGQLVQLEPGGRFMHVGIRIGDYWLHAHPHTGVELTSSLERFGHRIVRLANHEVPEPRREQIYYWLGKGFDFSYRWNCTDATYCSRLVADLLDVSPLPMFFEADHWRNVEGKPIGELGVSPDDLFQILLAAGYAEQDEDCPSLLAKVSFGKAARLYQ